MRAAAALVVVAVGAAAFALRNRTDDGLVVDTEARTFASDDPVERGCALERDLLVRLQRGHHPAHSEDVTIVPQQPNYSGTFNITSHSGPWDYLQTVPLVLYGPGYIRPRGRVGGATTLADVYPTMAKLSGIADLPTRAGKPLSAAIERTAAVPKLVVVLVWDGVGRNVMERWPDAWPELARLERDGTSFEGAIVGSSPSITPATHSTLGTGAFPVDHGVTAIEYRDAKGRVRGAFADRDPGDLELSTFADDIDRLLANRPRVGMLAWKSWHLGMLGHGRGIPGGDADELALIGDTISGNDSLFTTPPGINEVTELEDHAQRLDRRDGEVDGQWRGHDIAARHDNPAWVDYETELLLHMLQAGGYGSDEVPDFFFANYKMSDIAAHQYSMDSPEVEEVVAAQDAALGDLVRFLEEEVRDFVVVVTADHGHTPSTERSGAWPILQGQLADDVNRHFRATTDEPLIKVTSAAGPFLDRQVMARLGVSAGDVARFLNGYTIQDNWNETELPEGYEDRGGEHVLSAAFASDQYDDVMSCAGLSRG